MITIGKNERDVIYPPDLSSQLCLPSQATILASLVNNEWERLFKLHSGSLGPDFRIKPKPSNLHPRLHFLGPCPLNNFRTDICLAIKFSKDLSRDF